MLDIQKRMSNGFFALLSLPATAMGFALSVQISALSWILSTKYGLDIHEIGIVWAAGPIAGIVARYVFKINYFTLMGLIAGANTDPPALAFSNASAGNGGPSVGYSTVYPLSMFLRILTGQMIVLILLG